MVVVKSYGQRRRNVNTTNVSLFTSPTRPQPRINVLEVAGKLANLSVATPINVQCSSHEGSQPKDQRPERRVLAVKSGNEDIKTPVRQKAKKAIETPRQPGPITRLTTIERTTPQIKDTYQLHTASLLKHASRDITPFADWSSRLANHFHITKIAEASYGEVYRLSLLQPHPDLSKSDESVLKIIALKPRPTTKKLSKSARDKIDMMSDPNDVANEVRLIQHMACVPGFTNFRDMCVLKGRPGAAFVAAWQDWNAARIDRVEQGSTYPDPAKKSSYDADQLWAVIEMQDAGTDLERVRVDNIFVAWDVFWSIAISVAKGEESAEFEHRDLHLGNVCVSSKGLKDGVLELETSTIDTRKRLGFTGITTTIIDYTISRARICSSSATATTLRSTVSKQDDKQSDIAYLDLTQDPALFAGNGADDYQYDIYGYMRGLVYSNDANAFAGLESEAAAATATRINPNAWRKFYPLTNLVWLHFILHTISQTVHWPSELPTRTQNAKRKDKGREGELFRRAVQLEEVLAAVDEVLSPDVLGQGGGGEGVESTSGLLEMALERGWLCEDDILCA